MIVKDITTLKKYISTIVGDSFDIFESHVANANAWLKNELIGEGLYTAAEAAAEDDTVLSEFCERIISLRAYELAIPFIDLVQTNNGFAVASSDGLAPASQQRVKALIEASQKEQDRAIEELLAYLEKTDSYHEIWRESPCFSLLTDTYLHTLKEFKKYGPLVIATAEIYPKQRRQYAALNGLMRDIIYSKVEPVISPEQSSVLLKQLRDKAISNASEKLLIPVRFALACFTLGLCDKGDEYLRNALVLLKANPDLYPDWRDSAVGSAELARSEQKNDKPIFFAGI